ncbi:HPr family phosphocarrier protein [Streptomyces sp. NPDC005899]|uniref:HPr family phosphocarrier protein n=1 Tax=Streptomyces sp. NPDC005899 TaxID=3155716 RepID=UPI0033D69DD4
MYRRTLSVGSPGGPHARPASVPVQAAARQPERVTVARDGRDPVHVRSTLPVLAPAARHGDSLVLTATAAGAREAVEEPAALDLDAAV